MKLCIKYLCSKCEQILQFPNAFIFDFEQVIVSWAMALLTIVKKFQSQFLGSTNYPNHLR